MASRGKRRLATVLFVDIVDSTTVAADVGDRQWPQLLADFRAIVRRDLKRFGGHEVDTAGDGFFAWFDGPAGAIRAAAAIVTDVQKRGLDVRCGVHTGELEQIDGRLGGVGAHIGSRVASIAGPAQVLVTNTVRELAVGAEVTFAPPVETELKGVPGTWALLRVLSVDGTALPAPLGSAERAQLRAAEQPMVTRRRRVALPVLAAIAGLAALALLYAFGGLGAAALPSASPTASLLSAGSATPTASASPITLLQPIAMLSINPVNNRIDATVRDDHPGGDLILDSGNMWADQVAVLTRRDLATGGFLDSTPLPPNKWWGPIRLGLGSFWVGHDAPLGLIDRLDPTSGQLKHQIDPKVETYALAVGDTAVYLLDRASQLHEIDPFTNEEVAIHPTNTATAPQFVDFHGGLLYLWLDAQIALYDPATDTVVGTIPQYGPPLEQDPVTGITWVGDQGRSTIAPYYVAANTLGPAIGLAGKPRAIAFGFSSVWVAAEGYVIRIDPSGAVNTITMPDGATAFSIGTDVNARKVWVSTCQGCAL